MDLFVYGTLMVPEVMSAVSGYDGPGRPATLHGFRRRRVAGESYPAIVACTDESVSGTLYRGVEAAQCCRLDAFEGEKYRRQRVIVSLPHGPCEAEAYVFRHGCLPLLSDEPWSLERFTATHLEAFMSDYEGFLALR